MKNKTWIAVIILMMFTNAYALESSNAAQGAQEYDWQTCLNAKSSGCLNACTTSRERDCSDDCNSMANDKCVSEGLSPPQ